jgi:hypothetical protein
MGKEVLQGAWKWNSKSCLEITPGLSSHGGHLLRDATRWQVMFLSKPRPKYSGSGCILCEI